MADASALLAKGEARQAETTLEQALQRDPVRYPRWPCCKTFTSGKGGHRRRPSGSRDSRSGIRRSRVCIFNGLAQFELKKLEPAEASVRAALKLDPNTPEAYTLLGSIALARGSAEEGKAHLRTAIAAAPRKLVNYTRW